MYIAFLAQTRTQIHCVPMSAARKESIAGLARSSPTLVPQPYLSLGPVLGSGYRRDNLRGSRAQIKVQVKGCQEKLENVVSRRFA